MKVNSWPQAVALLGALGFVLGALALGRNDLATVGGVIGTVVNSLLPALVGKGE